jgi:hypothetical protein
MLSINSLNANACCQMQQAFIFKQMTFSVLDADLILILILRQNDAV